jgi:UDP-2,4-diacetamido-2,4,6-trideoxy-beta-L-altropyranose hydrolase
MTKMRIANPIGVDLHVGAKVLMRADAGVDIGIGHVMRCAALGRRLVARGMAVTLVSAGLPQTLVDSLQDDGIRIHPIAPMTDWQADSAATLAVAGGGQDLLIVDHYGIDKDWERVLRPHTKTIFIIDDLANRDHDCDLLLDQNLHNDARARYGARVAPGTRLFLGPRYALLREEFADSALPRVRDGSLRDLLVFFGGTDPGNQSVKVITALQMLGSHDFATTIVLGPGHPDPAGARKAAHGLARVDLIDSTTQMAQLMARADLALGTCGTAAWERCVLGLPSLVVITAENQREDAEGLAERGAARCLGEAEMVSSADWYRALRNAASSPKALALMAAASLEVMVGWRSAAAELEQELCNALG